MTKPPSTKKRGVSCACRESLELILSSVCENIGVEFSCIAFVDFDNGETVLYVSRVGEASTLMSAVQKEFDLKIPTLSQLIHETQMPLTLLH